MNQYKIILLLFDKVALLGHWDDMSIIFPSNHLLRQSRLLDSIDLLSKFYIIGCTRIYDTSSKEQILMMKCLIHFFQDPNCSALYQAVFILIVFGWMVGRKGKIVHKECKLDPDGLWIQYSTCHLNC